MKTLKVKYTGKRLRNYLIFGIIWMILGGVALAYNNSNVFYYGYLILGVLFLATYIFENKTPYLHIANGVISKKRLFSQRVALQDIKSIRKSGKSYILKTQSKHFTINTAIIEERSLQELKAVLNNLNLEMK
ncbi:hypothetical protein ACJD0Z_12100 [Flavobacteriaceae bacterium M23B6Z8]